MGSEGGGRVSIKGGTGVFKTGERPLGSNQDHLPVRKGRLFRCRQVSTKVGYVVETHLILFHREKYPVYVEGTVRVLDLLQSA